jgi:hypothetical protein
MTGRPLWAGRAKLGLGTPKRFAALPRKEPWFSGARALQTPHHDRLPVAQRPESTVNENRNTGDKKTTDIPYSLDLLELEPLEGACVLRPLNDL